jgi:hypothetical protein
MSKVVPPRVYARVGMKLRVTKIDAARRQLETAIELYFADRDPVAVHTLAAAAFEVLTDLRTEAGQPDEMMELIVTERRREVRDKLREAQNFFKHADRDGDAALDFDPATTELFLFLSTQRHAALAKNTLAMQCMYWWFLLHQPDLLTDPKVREHATSLGSRMTHWPRQKYWVEMHQAYAEHALTVPPRP